MSVKIIDHHPKLRADFSRSAGLFLRTMSDAIVAEANPKTPRRHGDLRNNVLKQVLGNHAVIAWRQRYAVYQEKKQFKNYTTSGTGPHYAENAVRKVVNQSQRYAKQVGLI